ncbi:MAG TPA: glycogen-binding domain-containing protein [Gemmatimonadaceae bacterium]|nr:glycogen-binding domain-containing protein [Gemmatimonadaceae bacterium]
MRLAVGLLTLGTALGAVGAPAAAQTSGYVDVDAAYVAPWDASVQHGLAISIAPAIRRDWRRVSLSSESGFTLSDTRHYYAQNSTTASVRSHELHGLVFEGGGSVSGLAYRSDGFRAVGDEKLPIARGLLQLQGHGRADFVLDKWGFSLTASGGENYGGAVHEPWALEAGMTRELRRVLVFANARADRFREYDSVAVYDVRATSLSSASSSPSSIETYRLVQPLLTVTGGATVAAGRAELTTELGIQQGQRALDPGRPGARRLWREFIGSVAATYRLAPRALLRIGAGMYPTDYIRQLPRGAFVSVGFRLERGRRQQVDWYRPPEIPAFRIDTLADGARVVRVRAPRALKVDVSADFTDWTPVPMRRARGDEWEAVLPIAPGTYRVSVRVDGGPWSAPPGLVGVLDEFNGEVGVVVIR